MLCRERHILNVKIQVRVLVRVFNTMNTKYTYWWINDKYGDYGPRKAILIYRTDTINKNEGISEYLTPNGWIRTLDYRNNNDNPYHFKTYREAMAKLYQSEGKVVCKNYYTEKRKPE